MYRRAGSIWQDRILQYAVKTVFSEPQVDLVMREVDTDGASVFAVEYLPGQFDQRADSAAQCIQIISQGERPDVRTARVYLLYGALTDAELAAIKKHVINPVDSREASLTLPETLEIRYEIPTTVETLTGFRTCTDEELAQLIDKRGLAMDLDDIRCCRDYFRTEQRDPTITELRMIDTYWSDHCRHTTFSTTLDRVTFEDPLAEKTYQNYLKTREQLGRTKPVNLMDVATLAVKYLRKIGKLNKLDESEEINACTVKITVEVDGKTEPWLLLFKNETHNHPTEIEPFGGAATCIGGAIRDPLSGRSYVYGAMRLTGAASPLQPVSETLPGKLPQRTICQTAAAGYASYGNQIGLATGKFITAFFHNAAVKEEVTALLERRDGLMCGICNGFQALIKLGLVPYGRIIDTDAACPTLTFNNIARHQSRIVRVRVASNRSPWLAATQVGDVYSVPISHGEGRFLADETLIRQLAANGQIATQYVDLDGRTTDDIHFNPNGSLFAVEGITSPDGRVFGKMGHAERTGAGLYKNVPGEYDMKMFASAVRYFR